MQTERLIMRTIHFLAHSNEIGKKDEFLAIKGEEHSDYKIPVYKRETDGKFHRLDRINFPACTKFFSGLEFKLNEDLTTDQIEQLFGEISALPW